MRRLIHIATAVAAFTGMLGAGLLPAQAAGGGIFLPLVSGSQEEIRQILVTVDRPTDRLIAQPKAGASPGAALMRGAAGVDIDVMREMSDGASVLKLDRFHDQDSLQGIVNRLMATGLFEYVEPDAIMQPLLTPDDPSFSTQWDLQAPVPGLMGANLPGAWDVSTGSTAIVMAVIDTGQLNHADLAGRFLPGYDFISDASIGNDGNGRDSNPADPGDWITTAEAASGFFAGCQVRNSSWHGTHVAGTMGAASNNASGVAGINWTSKIIHARVLGKCGGYTTDIVDGMRWSAGLSVAGVPANANPARVLNLSLGGSGACSATYQNAINAITAAGAVVAVAAGNSTANAANYSPASCAGVITVGSTGKVGNIAYYSNFGTSVEIAAPGGDKNADALDTILSTLNTGLTTPVADAYVKYQGTSMATPHVAGIASLMLSIKPSLTPAQVTTLIRNTATAFPAGSTCSTTTCGSGIINAAAAVVAARDFVNTTPPGAFNKISPTSSNTRRARPVTLTWGTSSGATSYEYCIDTTNNNACDTGWVSTGTGTSATPTLNATTTYRWQVRAVNGSGNTLANGGTWWQLRTR